MNKYFRYYFEALGSGFEIELVDDVADLSDLLRKFESEVRRLEKRFSRFLADSEVGHLNKNLNRWVAVSDDLIGIIGRAQVYSDRTDGYFSVGVEQRLSAMGYGINGKVGSPEKFLVKIDQDKVKVNSTIDLGGLGKGMALDMAKGIFTSLKGVCVNAGGDFYVKGIDEKGGNWKIFLENAFDIEEVIGEINIDGELFLASSNARRRRWSKGHHLINPKNGGLADEMAGVYVQAKQGELADVYSTALFAMGYEKAKKWLAKNALIEAMIISPEGRIFKTAGFLGQLYLRTD